MSDQHPLDWMYVLRQNFLRGERPEEVSGPLGTHGVTYGEDEDGDKFALVGLNFPPEVYAEIDDGTYGTMQGVRIYLEPRCASCDGLLVDPPTSLCAAQFTHETTVSKSRGSW